ncbi:MAG TPA: lysylphosphatidylglycerol synthase transmembrane domain-containing protein [Pseudonocardiaceae bacterium]|nr:lysylphosphatidylglycerol synthase transmembrane domain-containing protein [Pseudonocardiaceae bacterium]
MTRAAWPWLKFLLGVGILAALVWRLGSGAFLAGLRVVNGPAILAALAIGVLTTVCSAWRWQAVARGLGLELPLRRAIGDYYRSLFLNCVLPMGVLGDVQRAVHHGQSSGDVGRGVRAVVLERTGGQLVLAVVTVLVLLVQPSVAVIAVHDLTGVAIGAIVLAAVAALVIGVFAAFRWGRDIVRWRRAVATTLTDIRQGLLSRQTWPTVALLSTVVLAGHVGLFLVAARTAGSAAPLGQLVPLVILSLLASGVPVNIGGWGPRESMSALTFGAVGLGATEGLTIAVVYGVLTLVTALPGAAVLVVRHVSSRKLNGVHGQGARPRAVGPQVEFEERVVTEHEPAYRGS